LGITIIPLQGTYIQIQYRSGLASKGVIVYTGTADPDYCGDIIVLLYNSRTSPHPIKQGDRITQLVFHKVTTPVNTTTQITPEDILCNIFSSHDPHDNIITVAVEDFGTHETIDMVLH
jgi:dUTPase